MTTYRLDQWSKLACGGGNYLIDPDKPGVLFGKILDSDVSIAVAGRRGRLVASVTGVAYELGDPDPQYARRFPHAKERLFASLAEVSP